MRRASSRRDRVQASRSRQHEFVIDERVPPVDRTPPLVVAAFLVLADRVLAVSGLIELIESAGDPGVGKGQEQQDRDREQQARKERGHSAKAARHRRKVARMRARWCQLCRTAWSSTTNCAVTGAAKLSEKGAARSNSSSVNARTAAAAWRLFRRKSSSAAAFVTPAWSLACLAFMSATTSHVTSVNALPLAISTSIVYTLPTWCTMTPTERRSFPLPDIGVRHSASESPSAKAAKPAAPSSIRSASDAARRTMGSPYW